MPKYRLAINELDIQMASPERIGYKFIGNGAPLPELDSTNWSRWNELNSAWESSEHWKNAVIYTYKTSPRSEFEVRIQISD